MNYNRFLRVFAAVVGLLLTLLVIGLLSGCSGLPTVPPGEVPDNTVVPATLTTLPPADNTVVPSPEPKVTVVGNVWLRTTEDTKTGVLLSGTVVSAQCTGQWCYQADGLKFWRGCTDNNPDGLSCGMEE